MEHLRLFENYKSNEEIHEICEKYKIENYTINKDGSIDVDGNVNLSKMKISELPLTFNIVNGDFYCSYSGLMTLKGSPRIVNGDFWCGINKLTNLIDGPEEVNGYYSCSFNQQLTSLEGIAKIIGDLRINHCNLYDFKGIPGNFHISESIDFVNNPIYTNLKKFLNKYDIDIQSIKNKYLDLILEINELDAIQEGKIVDIRMDEVLYNIGLI